MLVWLRELRSTLTKTRSRLLLIGSAIAKRRTNARLELFLRPPSQRAGLQFALKPVTLWESESWEFGFVAELHTRMLVLSAYVGVYSTS